MADTSSTYTWSQLLSELRANLWPNGESSNLIASHDKAFLDAIIDLQEYIECLQSNNTTVTPACSTFYNCGLTALDAPRGRIKKVSVIDTKPPGSPAGTELFSQQFAVNLTDLPIRPPVLLGTVDAGGALVFSFNTQNPACGAPPVKVLGYEDGKPSYIDVGAQYFNASVIYEDLNGNEQIATQTLFFGACDDTEYMLVNVGSNTPVYVTIAPVNIPPSTGTANITVAVSQPASYISPEDDKYCEEIEYQQTDPMYVQSYYQQRARHRGRFGLGGFWGLGDCGCDLYPRRPIAARDMGVPSGLPALPLGYHYNQPDTDKRHRSRMGLWALERQTIYLIPWIQSTEKIIIKWDGIKRFWNDDDPIDNDPLLKRAIEEFVRADHERKWGKDYEAAQAAQIAYQSAKQDLFHECREETRVRGHEPSLARQSTFATGSSLLYYNDTAATATASCPSGQTGTAVNVTIPIGTVSSSLSVADANQQAQTQAQSQAQAQLSCQAALPIFSNVALSETATCGTGTGTPVTVNIPAGTYTSSISQDDADTQASAAAESAAQTQLICTWWNEEQTYVANCPTGQSGTPVSITIPAGQYSSTYSQDDANTQALNAATLQANNQIICSGGSGTFQSTQQQAVCTQSFTNMSSGVPTLCTSTVTFTVLPGAFTSLSSQADANLNAINYAQQQACLLAAARAQMGNCGPVSLSS